MEKLRHLDPYIPRSSKEAEGPITVMYRDSGVGLPDGMTEDNIWDAIWCAQEYVGHHSQVLVFIQQKLYNAAGNRVGGTANVLFDRYPVIRLSISAAHEAASATVPWMWSHITVGPAEEQLWATAFEEAFHAARILSGEGNFNSYYSAPFEPSLEEYRKYLRQPEERAVDTALNSGGILKETFGPTTVSLNKLVLHQRAGGKVSVLDGVSLAFPGIFPYQYIDGDGNLLDGNIYVRNEAELRGFTAKQL